MPVGSLIRRAVDVFRDYMDADNYIIAPRALTEPVATGDTHAPEGMEASGERESGREFGDASGAPQEPYATLVHQSLSIDIDDHPQVHGNGYSLDDAGDDEESAGTRADEHEAAAHGTVHDPAEDKAARKAAKAQQRRDNRARRAQARKEVVAKSTQASKKAVAKTAHSSRAAAAKTAHTSRAVAAKTAHTSRAAAVKTGQASRHAYNSSKQVVVERMPERKPIPRQTEMGSRRALFALIALSIGGFGIGTTEFVSMGLLKYIGADYGISDGAAGRIVTAYAMGVVVGAPLITALTGRIPRRRLLLLLMGAFTVGNGLSVFAPNYPFLIAARFIAGIPHGAFFGVSSLVAVSLSKPGKRGQAIAIVNLGLPIATLIGVPLAQAIGQAMSWHYAYAMVSLIGLATLVSIWIALPHMTLMLTTNPLTELSALIKPQVLLTLLMGTVGFGGMFAVYTYISWTMTEVAGLPASLMWIVLMSYGVGMIIGTWFGGKLVDYNPERGIFFSLIVMMVILTAFFFTSHNPWLGTINFALIGMSGSLLTPNLQSRLMDTAGEAQTLASALNQSALNLANAGGAMVGGWVVSAGFGYSSGGLAGALMALLSMIVWAPTALVRRRATASVQPVKTPAS